MRKLMLGFMLLGLSSISTAAFGVDTGDVEYVNGTIKGLGEGDMGSLNTSRPDALEFHASSGQFSIPYEDITTVRCRVENRFRLGVLPAIAVGLLKARTKRHFVTIEWKQADGPPDVVTLDASKVKAQGLVAVLRARAQQACPERPGQICSFGD